MFAVMPWPNDAAVIVWHSSHLFLAHMYTLAATSPGKPVEFRRRPEPEYDPFAHDDVPKTPHRIEVVEVRSSHGSR